MHTHDHLEAEAQAGRQHLAVVLPPLLVVGRCGAELFCGSPSLRLEEPNCLHGGCSAAQPWQRVNLGMGAQISSLGAAPALQAGPLGTQEPSGRCVLPAYCRSRRS